ncbi:XRE family transcriptional regulator [Mycobacterium sp. M1]|uniref:XRE family transcriptional regulator n=1 Tax=Mycolicibacter acidiphilus TaxID=2835306 RepID=A0ABS5RI32_9MYCO|nr:XRE family transcriptional regulator [Mycolicibacter acidiphilus]MBS9533259.1 XRE family transcriptional regulator [Mycolicibacter acidiphilus]
MTLAPNRRPGSAPRANPGRPDRRPGPTDRPVEFWSTSAIRSALQSGNIATWQQIVVALKRDPYGRTARQVEEVLEGTGPYGISKALSEVLTRTRAHLEANERAEVARHMRLLIERSGLSQAEFSSRIGVPDADLQEYLDGTVSPPASLMIRMRRLSDRFVKLHTKQSPTAN